MSYHFTDRLEKALGLHTLEHVEYAVQFPDINFESSFGGSEIDVKIGFKTEDEARRFAAEKMAQLQSVASKVESPPTIKNDGFSQKEIQGYLVNSNGKKIIDCIKGCSVLILQDAYIECNKHGLAHFNDHCSFGAPMFVLRDVIGSIDWKGESSSDL